jgi:glycosyltransferase involved in cell wall biosynthesis
VKVSIVVNNYNYGRFVGVAIDSALRQTHPDVEIVVVDDGSDDDSRDVIDAFDDRVRRVYQANQGQGAAFNAGFAASTGDIVMFLDADDALRPTAAERVVEAWRDGIAAVQFCLLTIDGDGTPLGGVYPPLPADWTPMRVRDTVRRAGFYPFPPTSGNAFARGFLFRVLPLPAERFRYGADGPLAAVAPLYGDVLVLTEPLGLYRIHGANNGAIDAITPDRFSYYVNLDVNRAAFLLEHARRTGVPVPGDLLERAFFHLQYRLASLKLRRDLHPVPNDRLPVLAWRLSRASLAAPDKRLLRLLVALWGWVVTIAPRPLAQRLVGLRFIGGNRPPLVEGLLRRLGLVRRTAPPLPGLAAGE